VIDERASAGGRQPEQVLAEERRIVFDAGQRQQRRGEIHLRREAVDHVATIVRVGCEEDGWDPVAGHRNPFCAVDACTVISDDEHHAVIE
jgi:hypothetical protein